MTQAPDPAGLRELLLVGSVPLASVEEVFGTAGTTIGEFVSALPDGEVGERLSWTGYLADHVFAANSALEQVSRPAYDTQQQPPEHDHHWQASKIDLSQVDSFRVRDAVKTLAFDDLYAGGVAVESYRVFKRLRDAGTVPSHVRFQVCLPGTTSAIEEFFGDHRDWPMAKAAYQAAVRAEIERMLEVIPAEDLSIQFDLAWEIVDLSIGEAPAFPWSPMRTYAEKVDAHVEGVRALVDVVPDSIVVGVHWCYGTWGGWPMNEMADLELCVDMTCRTLAACSRRLDYAHVPVAEDAGTTFFAPLERLRGAPCKLYLGLLHHTDGAAGFARRWALASEYVPNAGVAAVCGFGRLSPAILPEAFELHRQAGLALRE